MLILFFFILIFSAVCEAIWNIALFRAPMSWLPMFDYPSVEGFLNIRQTEFHLFKGFQITILLWFLQLVMFQGQGVLIGIVALPIIWLVYYGILFPYLYHVLLIKPKYWRSEIERVFPFNWLKFMLKNKKA